MSDKPNTVYVYDGSFDGFLCAIFAAFEERPRDIASEYGYQPMFFDKVKTIETDPVKSERVITGINKKLGNFAYEKIYYAWLSLAPDAAITAFDWLKLAFKQGGRIEEMLNDDRVIKINTLVRRVGREGHLLKGFIRFGELKGGLYFAEIEPKYNVLPVIMPHFCDRFNSMPFIIHDKSHRMAGVYDTKEWFLTPSDDMKMPVYTDCEQKYQDLWKTFYDTIGIKERYNPRCRRNLMPKYFWKNMVEVKGER